MAQPYWQRLRYMPATPLYPDKPHVTASKEHRQIAYQAAVDGMVLLKNEGLLPFKKGTRLAVFGKAQADYVKGGGGSGDTTVAYVRTLVDGLMQKEQEGKIACFAPLTDYYQANVGAQYADGRMPGQTTEPDLPETLLQAARAYTNTALIAISRFSTEGYDRTGHAFDGDYFLSREEAALISRVKAAFPRIAVILNVGGMMDTAWFCRDTAIQAALLAGQAGMEGGMAMASLLCGDECPSGHLTDTFVEDFSAYPSSAGFNASPESEKYEEDIYVGYRYFETIEGAADKVLYPFGFGLSYTTFSLSGATVSQEGDQFILCADVENTGDIAGRYVLEAYASAPQGLLGKPRYVLVGFAKTDKLQPHERQTLTIVFSAYDFASYDDTGKIQKSAYVLEKGDYRFFCGEHVRALEQLSFVCHLDSHRVLDQLTQKCAPVSIHRRLCASGDYEELPCEGTACTHIDAEYPFEGQAPVEWAEEDPEDSRAPTKRIQLDDVADGKITLDTLMDALTVPQMIHLLGGQPNRGVANTFGVGNLPLYGIPNVMTADGPSGLRILPRANVYTTAFPCPSQLACTWDVDWAYRIGRAGAEEVLENGVGFWLTPAVNIHRTPLCGRNFEYYSEDPLLAGKMAARMIEGIQQLKVSAALKHFCCNNKETMRRETDSCLSERALREIYLKPFEICVREAQPFMVMSAYNRMNGWRTSQNKELLTDILRGEWGFEGFVVTDWSTHGDHFLELKAGNDLKMRRGSDEALMRHLENGDITLEEVKLSVRRILQVLLKMA